MKLDIKRFSDALKLDVDALQEINATLTKVGNESVEAINQIILIMKELNGQELLGSATPIINDILNAMNTFTGNKFQPAFSGLSTALTSIIGTVSELDINYGDMIKSWSADMQSIMGMVRGGLNSQVEKGSYPLSDYIKDVSASGKTIIKETANIFQKTGDVYKSYTGQTIAQTAVGAIKGLMSFVSGGRSGVSAAIGNIMG